MAEIIDAIKETIEETPPELVADIMDQGSCWPAAALLAGLDKRVAEATQMPVHIADDPLTCVVRGPGACSKTWTRWSACWSASSSPRAALGSTAPSVRTDDQQPAPSEPQRPVVRRLHHHFAAAPARQPDRSGPDPAEHQRQGAGSHPADDRRHRVGDRRRLRHHWRDRPAARRERRAAEPLSASQQRRAAGGGGRERRAAGPAGPDTDAGHGPAAGASSAATLNFTWEIGIDAGTDQGLAVGMPSARPRGGSAGRQHRVGRQRHGHRAAHRRHPFQRGGARPANSGAGPGAGPAGRSAGDGAGR